MKKSIFNRTTFTKQDKELLAQFHALSASSNFVADNAEFIMIRTKTLSLPGNLDTFVINTSAHPGDEIFYTVSVDEVDLSVKDGGYF
jgi:hypothetical protein